MNRRDRRMTGDDTPLVTIPEGEGDEPRIQLSQQTIDHALQTPGGPNLYRCRDCGGSIVTVHRHRGTTPMYLPCGVGEGCGGEAVSAFYPTPPLPAEVVGLPLFEWYRPGRTELAQLPHYRDHVERGGVLIRRRDGGAPPEAREETNVEKRTRVARTFGGIS